MCPAVGRDDGRGVCRGVMGRMVEVVVCEVRDAVLLARAEVSCFMTVAKGGEEVTMKG